MVAAQRTSLEIYFKYNEWTRMAAVVVPKRITRDRRHDEMPSDSHAVGNETFADIF